MKLRYAIWTFNAYALIPLFAYGWIFLAPVEGLGVNIAISIACAIASSDRRAFVVAYEVVGWVSFAVFGILLASFAWPYVGEARSFVGTALAISWALFCAVLGALFVFVSVKNIPTHTRNLADAMHG